MGLHAQRGILVVTPGTTGQPGGGNGLKQYSGDGGAATNAGFASPNAVAYDAQGNLYIADSGNHVVRRIGVDGIVHTVAGNGRQGFSGDIGPAILAELNTPSGVIVDSSGILYVADTQNNCVRRVDTRGVITTIAGSFVAGFSGDGGMATLAKLRSPGAVALDKGGALLITDVGNHRIRRVGLDGMISTIAGNGEEGFSGDGGSAVAAGLDRPSAVAVDRLGQIYITDSSNHRVRVITADGKIHTLAGSGVRGYSDGGGDALRAQFSFPTGIAVDDSGTFYVADRDNNRIRQIRDQVISTIAGTSVRGSTGDGGPAATMEIDSPGSTAVDTLGNITIADQGNARVRKLKLATISFAPTDVGASSATHPINLSNEGAGSLQVNSVSLPSAFTLQQGTCGAFPIVLGTRAQCALWVKFAPVLEGVSSGALDVNAGGDRSQRILLSGTALPNGQTKSVSVTTLDTGGTIQYVGVPIDMIASVKDATGGGGVPSGTITFNVDDAPLAEVKLQPDGRALYSTMTLAAGMHQLTARYSGDVLFATSISAPMRATITAPADFGLRIAGGVGSMYQTVKAGSVATYYVEVAPKDGAFPYLVSFSVAGLPAGSSVAFEPTNVVPSAPIIVAVSIRTAAKPTEQGTRATVSPLVSFGILSLVWPFYSLKRRSAMHRLPTWLCVAALAMLCFVSGCGKSGFLGGDSKPGTDPSSQTYAITITGHATGYAGLTMTHSLPASLVVTR